MAEGFTDDQLQELVDGYTKKQIRRSISVSQRQREGRYYYVGLI